MSRHIQLTNQPTCHLFFPGYNRHSTAEVALMLMLMLMRRATEAQAVFRAREVIGGPVGRELCGKTLGIVGLGRVGSCLATAVEALGMQVCGGGREGRPNSRVPPIFRLVGGRYGCMGGRG